MSYLANHESSKSMLFCFLTKPEHTPLKHFKYAEQTSERKWKIPFYGEVYIVTNPHVAELNNKQSYAIIRSN